MSTESNEIQLVAVHGIGPCDAQYLSESIMSSLSNALPDTHVTVHEVLWANLNGSLKPSEVMSWFHHHLLRPHFIRLLRVASGARVASSISGLLSLDLYFAFCSIVSLKLHLVRYSHESDTGLSDA